MGEIILSGLSNSTAELSEGLAGLELLAERMMTIQSDSLKSTQLEIAKILESYRIPDAVKTMANFTEGIRLAIPKIDIPIGTIAAMQDLQKAASTVLQASVPNLSQIANIIGTSMMRFQTVSSFLRCCETTTWPLFFIASEDAEKDLAHYIDVYSNELDLTEIVNEYAIDYLDSGRIANILNEWLGCNLISNNKKPLLKCAIKHHLNEDYYASTCILMCLVEGLIEDCDSEFNALASCDEDGLEYVAKHLGLNDGIVNRRKKGYAKDQLAAITYGVENAIYYWEASAKYIATATLANNPSEILYLSNPLRNKICHGSQVYYGTIIHSLKAILVVDLLVRLSQAFKSNSDDE